MTMVKLKPAVPKYWLVASAGVMWSAVGIMLCRLAWIWLLPVIPSRAELLGGAGIFGAVIVYYFGFSKLALKNIHRLGRFSDKTCFFAFQAWKSYFLIGFMIALGITLRHSSFPKAYLAVIYATIGGALFLSSFHYYMRLYRMVFQTKTCASISDDSH